MLVGGLQAGDPVHGGGEQDPVHVQGGGDAQPDGPVRLSGGAGLPRRRGYLRVKPALPRGQRPGGTGRPGLGRDGLPPVTPGCGGSRHDRRDGGRRWPGRPRGVVRTVGDPLTTS